MKTKRELFMLNLVILIIKLMMSEVENLEKTFPKHITILTYRIYGRDPLRVLMSRSWTRVISRRESNIFCNNTGE